MVNGGGGPTGSSSAPESAAAARVLARVASWPVPNASAALVAPSGIVAAVGDLDRVYPLASVTKPLAALATLVAVEEEAVTLADPVAVPLLAAATLRHLLSHASGVAPERLLRSYDPGVRRVYSNVGYDLIGSHVSAATGIGFNDYFRQALVEPLGLRATSLVGSPARDGRSTVRDLARVAQELLAPAQLLHPSTLAQATTVQFPGLRGVLPGYGVQNPNDWGLGFDLKATKAPHWTALANSPETFGHFGQCGTMFWVDPVACLGLVALTDRDFGPWAAAAWPELGDALLALQPGADSR